MKLFTKLSVRASIFVALGGLLQAGNVPQLNVNPAIGALPLLLRYQAFRFYLNQTIGDNPSYSTIEAYFNDAKGSDLCLALTHKGDKAKTYYCNVPAVARAYAADGREAYATPIDVRKPDEITKDNRNIEFAFRAHDGAVVRWRFICAQPVTSAGGGVDDLASTPGVLLQYRDQGTIADKGSAVQIGDKVSMAEVWSEISQAPYFVAYRGYFVDGYHITRFATGQNTWQVEGDSSQFQLVNPAAASANVTVSRNAGSELTISALPAQSNSKLNAKVNVDGNSYLVSSIGFEEPARGLSIVFRSGLSVGATGSGPVDFNVEVAGHKEAQGTVESKPVEGGYELTWKFKAPSWAKNRLITETVKNSGSAIVLDVRQN